MMSRVLVLLIAGLTAAAPLDESEDSYHEQVDAHHVTAVEVESHVSSQAIPEVTDHSVASASVDGNLFFTNNFSGDPLGLDLDFNGDKVLSGAGSFEPTGTTAAGAEWSWLTGKGFVFAGGLAGSSEPGSPYAGMGVSHPALSPGMSPNTRTGADIKEWYNARGDRPVFNEAGTEANTAPVPESPTILLLGLGMILLLGIGLKRKKPGAPR